MMVNSKLKTLLIMLLSLVVVPVSVYAGNHENVSHLSLELDKDDIGDIKQHELFEFEASIKESDIIDGSGDFDGDNDPGNDSGPNNGIVRSWDTVTYPIKITINPKKADMLENIKLKITGTLDNGVTDGNRINAKFAVGGKENIAKEEVSFEQYYTMERTGNSVMIPVTVEVQGAKNGVELRPDIKVEVISIDGDKIEDAVADFDELPSATVSSKVSIKPIIGSGLAGNGINYYPYARINGDEDDRANMHAYSISWGIRNLPGKSSIKGSTFPDPNGKINFEMDFSGHVAWDGKPSETFDFEGRDTPFMLLDHRPISRTTQSIGSPNTLLEGEPYTFPLSVNYSPAAVSFMTESQRDHSTYWRRAVWDSGDWSVDEPTMGQHKINYTGHNTGYEIGSTFPIHRADGWAGGRAFGVNERVFASESFLVYMPNEYRIGGPNNPDGIANNANYRVDVKMLSYTDEFGETVPFENQLTGSRSFSERNNPSGSMSVQTTMYGFPSGAQLGTPNIGWSQVSKGDASTLIGEDIRFESAFYSMMPLYGGLTSIARWNTDAFELTPEYAQRAINYNIGSVGYYTPTLRLIRNDHENQQVRFGIENFVINHDGDMMAWFNEFTKKGIHDYKWFDSYDEAIATGKPVAAVQNDITAPVGPKWGTSNRFPLKVKHDNIGVGSKTMDETANIAVTNTYAYLDDDRKNEIDVTKNRAYHRPAIWDSSGNMIDKQSPSGGSINFETLAVTPAETATRLTTDKMTYYNSEVIKWKAENSIVLPRSGTPNDLDAGVTIEHTLPKGLDYRVGSGKVGDDGTEPELTILPNGSSTLQWRVLMSDNDRSIPDITFETSINPFALNSSGVQSSVEVKGVIESDLDQRPVHLRTNTHSVTVLKVGMVGIYETIDKLYGGKNTDYTLTLRPYTTVEDEKDVVGLTHVPENKDENGSSFSGEVMLNGIDVNYNRLHDGDISIYLNNSHIESSRPHRIDAGKDGWYKYDSDTDLSRAKSILFKVNGLMSNRDDITIELNIETKDNEFGDQYLNKTVINSDTDYRLSPISNTVRYTIRADLELTLGRVRIYTDKATNGLPISALVDQVVLDKDKVKDLPITISIYDDASGDKVGGTTIQQKDLKQLTNLNISTKHLEKGEHRSYTIKLEGYDRDLVWVKDGMGEITMDGYTATEEVLDNERVVDKEVKLIMATQKTLGGPDESYKYYETFEASLESIQNSSSGYGYEVNSEIKYSNELLQNALDLGINDSVELSLEGDSRIIDSTLDYEVSESSKFKIPLESNGSGIVEGNHVMKYQLPEIFMQDKTGDTYTSKQVEDLGLDDVVEAGNKLYIPIWIDEIGQYDLLHTNHESMGSNHVSFELTNTLDIDCYMLNHIGSDTQELDVLLLHPLNKSNKLFDKFGQ